MPAIKGKRQINRRIYIYHKMCENSPENSQDFLLLGLASLSEWKERVAECRSSGLKVREWCRMHEIGP